MNIVRINVKENLIATNIVVFIVNQLTEILVCRNWYVRIQPIKIENVLLEIMDNLVVSDKRKVLKHISKVYVILKRADNL